MQWNIKIGSAYIHLLHWFLMYREYRSQKPMHKSQFSCWSHSSIFWLGRISSAELEWLHMRAFSGIRAPELCTYLRYGQLVLKSKSCSKDARAFWALNCKWYSHWSFAVQHCSAGYSMHYNMVYQRSSINAITIAMCYNITTWFTTYIEACSTLCSAVYL